MEDVLQSVTETVSRTYYALRAFSIDFLANFDITAFWALATTMILFGKAGTTALALSLVGLALPSAAIGAALGAGVKLATQDEVGALAVGALATTFAYIVLYYRYGKTLKAKAPLIEATIQSLVTALTAS